MIRRSLLILLCPLLMLATSGCWNRAELDTLGIATALGIDKVDHNEYLVSAQIVNPMAIGKKSNGDSPVYIVEERGKTVIQALRRMTTQIPRKVYLSHLGMIVFSDQVAREGLAQVIDLFVRDPEVRADTFMVIGQNAPASTIISILPRLEQVPANKIFKTIQMSQANWAPTVGVRLDDFIQGAISLGRQPVITGVKLVGKPEEGSSLDTFKKSTGIPYIRIPTIAVFNSAKLVGYLGESESKGLNYILNNVKSTIGILPCNKGISALEVVNAESTVKSKMMNGRPEIFIHVKVSGNIAELNCDEDLLEPDAIRMLEQEGRLEINRVIQSTVDAAQKTYGVDFVGFGNRLHQDHWRQWRKMERKWDKIFPTVKVHIDSKVKILRIGTETNPLKYRRQEAWKGNLEK
ncbi:Ger(x)C family spore germination protein [Paenibacillus guangzhouensis]|uniref:Ger(x)C family spore germination protein n=1 Tax=Paenibacillus guangzhouensis TaxID=1473112 RepID=UPI001266BCDE|nr:Ger(x)C family spore germination protein [Paenibacillus guangzhouensis]